MCFFKDSQSSLEKTHREDAYCVCYIVLMYVCMLDNSKRKEEEKYLVTHKLLIFSVDWSQRLLEISRNNFCAKTSRSQDYVFRNLVII